MEIHAEIDEIRRRNGKDLLILAHHYQQEEVFRHADVHGDSYALALAASRSSAAHIVFCGVSFMAESARILTGPEQQVYLPDSEAGCPLADMVEPASFEKAVRKIKSEGHSEIVPIVYINSSAKMKAVVAEYGGFTCTSSNALPLVKRELAKGKSVFFLPDRNLGQNTAIALGLGLDEWAIVPRSGEPADLPSSAKMLIWDGFCNVHTRFKPSDVLRAKNLHPYARILVHPECDPEVVALADYSGSTSGIIREFEKTQEGTVLFIGTEINFVRRLQALRPGITVFPLRESGCVNMNKISASKLLSTLQSLGQTFSPFAVDVPAVVAAKAAAALQGMIDRVETERKN